MRNAFRRPRRIGGGGAIALTLVLSTAVVLTGCATVLRSNNVPVSIEAPHCERDVECSLSHKKGTYKTQVPGTVTVRRSDDPLRLRCKAESGETWLGDAHNKRTAASFGNILAGGIIGGIIDANTDAHHNYPDRIVIPLCAAGRELEPPILVYPGGKTVKN